LGSRDFEQKFEDNKNRMLMIRLARFGAKKKPFYRVVVIEKERARDSRNLEVVGQYNPLTTPAKVELNRERIAYWTKNGAQLSDTVERLMKNNPAPAAA
jgi:small subunit ribosomal protein S16